MTFFCMIIIYLALLGNFPSLATSPRTGQSRAAMIMLQLFLIKYRELYFCEPSQWEGGLLLEFYVWE